MTLSDYIVATVRFLAALRSTIRTLTRKFLNLGSRGVTIMLVPHSEKRVLRAETNLLAISFIGGLLLVVVAFVATT